MISSVRRRRVMLGLGLLLTLMATAYTWVRDRQTPKNTDLVVAAIVPDLEGKVASTKHKVTAGTASLPERQLQDVGRDIFAVLRKEPDPDQKKIAQTTTAPPSQVLILTPPQIPLAPPLPTAPSLPFTYIGKLGEEGRYTVFLSNHGRNFAVKAGDVIGQLYRVEGIRPPILILTYLPTNIKQTMQIGESN